MNKTQEALCEIIYRIASIKNISSFGSTISYGLTNYVARFSLMSDEYFVSKQAKNHILKSWSINPLTRSIKSKKNGFTYEHVIPSSFVTKEILKNPSKDNIEEVLIATDFVAIITQIENNGINLISKMPEGWKIGDDPWIRYKDSNITILKEKIRMSGVAKR